MAFNFFFFFKSISGSQSCLCFLTLGKTDTLELQLKEGNSLHPQTRKWWLISEMKRRHASQGLNRAICCGHDLGLGFWGRHSLEYIIWYSDFLGCDLWAASVYLWDCLELEGKEDKYTKAQLSNWSVLHFIFRKWHLVFTKRYAILSNRGCLCLWGQQ